MEQQKRQAEKQIQSAQRTETHIENVSRQLRRQQVAEALE